MTIPLTASEYQEALTDLRKAYPSVNDSNSLPTFSHGLLEECGEVAGLLKRYYRGDADDNLREKLTNELGDVLAYLVLLGSVFDINLEDIMIGNIRKIESRAKKGTVLGRGSER